MSARPDDPVAGDSRRRSTTLLRRTLTGGRYRVPAVALTGLLAATVIWSAPATNAVARQAPALTLVSTVKAVTGETYPDFTYIPDLGLNLVGGAKALKIVAERAAYDKPVKSTLTVGSTKTVLPKGLADFTGMQDFLTVSFTDAAGRVVAQQDSAFCPSGGDRFGDGGGAGRARPDAPDSSPFPRSCSGGHPFTLGTIYGLQAGWATPVGSGFLQGLALPAGKYKVKVTIGPRWRTILHVPAAKASATVSVTLTTPPQPEPEPTDSPTASPTVAPGSSPATGSRTSAGAAHAHGDDVLRERAAAAATPADRQHSAWVLGRSTSGRGAAEAGRHAAQAHEARLAEVAATAAAVERPTTGARALAAAPSVRPDLQALPAFGTGLVKGKDLDEEIDPSLAEHTFLTFAATVWNAGPSPLVVEGFRRPGKDVMDAYQYFYDRGKQLGYRKVGAMEYDPRTGHEHWHFKDFAEYSLLDASRKNRVLSAKEAFCLAPTDAIDLRVRNAEWNPGSTGLASACGSKSALSIRENLDSGWGDTYGQYLPGQSFDVTNLPNGTYHIEVLANPVKRLIETSTTNNRALRKVVLGGTPGGARTLAVPPYMGIDTDGSIP